ncbi:MAG: hypothetical protein RLZZ500_2223 [Bacteroidota bacterium]|jgi:hypothetical protein
MHSHALSHRLREVFIDGKWIANTNYQEQITGLTVAQALQKPMGLNSIAALTFHINYYLEGLIPVFNGQPLTIKDQYSFDLPLLQDQAAWEALTQRLLTNAAVFIACVEKCTDTDLKQPFAEEKYGTYQRNIEGVLEHSYYHLGQIVLLRKMVFA